MKAFLMHPDRDFGSVPTLANEQELRQDLELDTVLEAMAAGDPFLLDVARIGLLSPLVAPEEIRFRQAVLADCLAHPEVIRELYALVLTSVRDEKRQWGFFWRESPESIASGALSVLRFFLGGLRELRAFADEHGQDFASEGLIRLFTMLRSELSDDYFAEVEQQLATMRLEQGTLLSARLGQGNKAVDYVLRLAPQLSWRDRLGQLRRPPSSFDIHPRDQASLNALAELKGRGLNLAANALAQSADHIKSFFTMLLTELGFYIGCLNLRDRLEEFGAATCLPEPCEPGSAWRSGWAPPSSVTASTRMASG